MGMKCIVTALLLLMVFVAAAQDSSVHHSPPDSFIIHHIILVGNHKTKDDIILRELPFAEGDTIANNDLTKKLILAKQQVVNTSLFLDVNVATTDVDSNQIDIAVTVKERWYFLPVPYFRLVDRNFNQWWTVYHRNLNRVNYGVKLIQNNVSGRNDNAYLWLITGYSHQVAARYDMPFIDKHLHQGLSFATAFSRQREINYGTDKDNKQLFYKGNNFVRQQFRAEVSYLYRPAIKTKHSITFRWMDEKLNDTILQLNPNYFPYSRIHIGYPVITYKMQYSDADNIVYPTNGFVGDVSFIKKGFGSVMNLWQLNYHAKYTMPLYPHTQLQLQSAGLLSLPFKQPFFNKQIVNYYSDFFIQGLEYYVIDGVAATINRATLRQQIFSYDIKNPLHLKNHDIIPVKVYLKGYGNAAYVYDNQMQSRFNNKFIATYGLGLDIVTVYDIVIRLEYSFNQYGDHNLYLHSKGDF